jgi:iron(III) transport system ATP-binding protein
VEVETSAALDAALKDEVRWKIRSALKAANVPAICVTHDQEEALSGGDNVGVLRGGQLEQLGSPETRYSQPGNRFVGRFLGAASFLEGELNPVNNEVLTMLGVAPGHVIDRASSEVSILLRPDDPSLTLNPGGNAQVSYEGSARLYGVTTDDGEQLKVRCDHEIKCHRGDRVELKIVTKHPLAVFGTDK